MGIRVRYTRKHSWNTRSNQFRTVKTPGSLIIYPNNFNLGGRVVIQYMKKKASAPKCGVTGTALQGVKTCRPKQYRRLKKRHRRVSRPYGGTLSAGEVRDR